MKLTRQEVYALIDGERDYQDSLRAPDGKFPAGVEANSEHCVGEHLTMLRTYMHKADVAWTENSGADAALDVIRKIAAIAVHCMEDHGAPPRVISEDIATQANRDAVKFFS